MNIDEISCRIREIIMDCLQLSELKIENEENLVEKLSINSIDAIGIFLMIEEAFEIQIDDDDLGVELIESINNMANYIEKKRCNE